MTVVSTDKLQSAGNRRAGWDDGRNIRGGGGCGRLGHNKGSSHGDSRIYRFAYEEVRV